MAFAARVQKLKAGECHIAADPKLQQVETLRADRNIVLLGIKGD